MIRIIALFLCAWFACVQFANAQSAADEFYDPEEMAAAREALQTTHGAQLNSLVMGERFEYQAGDGDDVALWEGQAWFGNDNRRVWLKTEGEYVEPQRRFEEAEIQALYSHAISPFWDLQVGLRHDVEPSPSRTYAVVGLQGLAPYWFEMDGALFLSNRGDVSARLEVEYEFRLTQRLFLQPRLELNAALEDDEAIGVGSGLSTIESGLRLRYEVRREFAPYLGISWSQAVGNTKTFQRVEGADSDQFSLVAGLRFWF